MKVSESERGLLLSTIQSNILFYIVYFIAIELYQRATKEQL